MTIRKRVSKKGVSSYQFRVSLGYKDGQQIVKCMTWTPEEGMTQKQIKKEVTRQSVLFEERANAEYQKELEREKELREQEENETEYAKTHTTFKEIAKEWLALQEVSGELKNSSLLRMKGCQDRTYDAIGDVLVSKLSYRKVQTFITSLAKKGVNKLTGEGLSEKTQKDYLTFISDVIHYAKKCGLIENNPCKDITFVKTAKKKRLSIPLKKQSSC